MSTNPSPTTPTTHNILVVEDDSFISLSFVNELTEEGFTAIAVETTKAAEEALAAQPIHFILLDIMLPNEDGLTFLQKLQKDANYRSIPVMILSNLGDVETVNRAKKLGAVDYVVKAEQTPAEIAQKIRQYLQPQP